MADETEALRAEVAELRAEVERLRLAQASHVCASVPVCNCGSAAMPGSGCLVHSWPVKVWMKPAAFINACAGGAAAQPVMIDANSPVTFMLNTAGCAPAAIPQLVTFNGGGQY